jgi:phenylacetate-CoA ligase
VDLPVLTKNELMASFDELVTDKAVRLSEVRAFLDQLEGYRLFHGRYWVARTSGSTGNPGIFIWNRDEWSTVIASYARAQAWAGIEAGVLGRVRLGVVSSRIPWHQSALVGMSVDAPFVPVRRFDATQPLDEIVAGLNEWQPENLVCYASMGRTLAEEQLAGRLRIGPRAVMCSSEVLTAESRSRIHRAFGREPFNVYAATETAAVASECEKHRMHFFEDLVIAEVVDERNRPVPPGTVGAKVLVTVLFSRTQPLIRYEMSDTISTSVDQCSCGRSFGLLGSIEGRIEDVITLPARSSGHVSVHPNVFHQVLEPLPVVGWQVEQAPDRLLVRLIRPQAGLRPDAVVSTLARAIESTGASSTRIEVLVADDPSRTMLGKAPLIKALR